MGIINWDGASEVWLRATRSTAEQNILQTLPFNTHVQVIRLYANGWSYISTPGGQMGFIASEYLWTHLPEPGARLHRVEPGTPSTAIAIAETYYDDVADQWGQDLRFYVNVLAYANRIPVPASTTGWREVHFNHGTLIWIPSRRYAQSLLGVVNSGSISLNFATSIASSAVRIGQLWDDFGRAIALSVRYLREAVGRHAKKALFDVIMSLAEVVVGGIALLAISTAVGAAIGALAGGVGVAPGAAAGFEIGLIILEWLGLAMLLQWAAESLWNVSAAFVKFIGIVWNARGNAAALEHAAREFAEAVALLLSALIEGLFMLAASRGVIWMVRTLRGTATGRAIGEARMAEWFNERLDAFREKRGGRPRDVLGRFYRGVELVEQTSKGKEKPNGEFDGVDMNSKLFIEYKATRELHRENPRTGQVQQTPAEWAEKQIRAKTEKRIQSLLHDAVRTRSTVNGSAQVPALAEIRGFRRIQFRIDGDTPALRTAVAQALNTLRANHLGWMFEIRFGVNLLLPPLPDWATAGH
ncbi:hypothetical protein CYFUS_008798 [Cystobacter fuscus]|uniref:NAD(+)--protein-arginine ADP-ribosyltransferase Tre1-like N-terminal domain-containing protein n=1 Tax=Cystobacter fuscus TaxID=43 RepID=A0A250JI91_9BACT|nr:SH3 domain-containing protein [Cystobacter fuscus]ATB43318.1 hypothetical protein CYFUS_008798 [Cystobacter fuscus]